jgi:NADPH:quinone reductase-like Zn-dependent oxidoreductase
MGAELCGRVREVGARVEGFAAGDRVMANPGIVGAWADRVLLPASACGRAPRNASDAEAAAIPVRALAAWQALGLLDLPEGATLLVVGAGGAVGRAAVEMARGQGLRVLAIAGATELAPLHRLGAELAVDHRTEWERRLAPAAPRGADAALDLVGGESLVRALALLGDAGRVVTTISGAARSEAPRGISIRFLAMRSTAGDLDAIADLVERGGLTTPIARTYGLEEAPAALDAMRSRDRAQGELVLLS